MFFDCIKYSLKGLLSKKIRFLLTVISIFVGIVSITVISAIGNSGKTAVVNELEALGLNGATIKSKKTSIPYENIENLKEKFGNECYISSLVREPAILSINNKEYDTVVWGGEEEIFDILSLDIIYGRGIRKNDILENKRVIILTENISKRIFENSDSLGKVVHIETAKGIFPFTVVGITATSKVYDMVSENIPAFVYIPETSFSDISVMSGIKEISVMSKTGKDIELFCKNMIEFLEKEDNKNNYYFENMNMYKKSISDVLEIVTIIVTLVGAVSLLVGGVSVMNTMLMSVNERKKEIGIKKALGFNNYLILAEFLLESLIIIVISCILGVVAGLFISYVVMTFFGLKLVIDFSLITKAILISFISGMVFGVYPALKASGIDPVKCLNN